MCMIDGSQQSVYILYYSLTTYNDILLTIRYSIAPEIQVSLTFLSVMRAQFRLLLLTLLAYLGSYWNDMQRSWSLSDDGRCLRPAWLLLRKPLPPLTRPEELGRQQLEHLRMRGEDVSWVHGGSSIPPYRAALRHFRLRCRVCSPAGLLRLRLFAAQLPTWRQWW